MKNIKFIRLNYISEPLREFYIDIDLSFNSSFAPCIYRLLHAQDSDLVISYSDDEIATVFALNEKAFLTFYHMLTLFTMVSVNSTDVVDEIMSTLHKMQVVSDKYKIDSENLYFQNPLLKKLKLVYSDITCAKFSFPAVYSFEKKAFTGVIENYLFKSGSLEIPFPDLYSLDSNDITLIFHSLSDVFAFEMFIADTLKPF